MNRLRLFLFILTLAAVVGLGALVAFYARGYRFDTDSLRFSPNGLLVAKSHPDGAQVFISGELKTATNATLPLPPGTYDVEIRKEGYMPWSKRLVIEKEVVTETTAHLFKSAPSLSAITFAGAINPVASADLSKIAYAVAPVNLPEQEDKAGLWVMETVNLPIGFSREPRRITDGDLVQADWIWSPDEREILLSTSSGTYLLDAGTFTSQGQRINLTAKRRQEILDEWEEERKKRLDDKLKKLPDELSDILSRRTSSIVFSPDEDMIIYTASSSAEIPENLIKPLPGASTQRQERNIKPAHTYVYDIKEDRNFLITDQEVVSNEVAAALRWFPTSRHLVLAEENKITIIDYDGANRQVVYSGSYVSPHAYPTLAIDRLLILTTLGAQNTLPNLYSLSLK